MSRRSVLALAVVGVLARGGTVRGQAASWPDWSCAPIGWPGEIPGVGFRIGHGFACENTWFAAGWWHTGEDWYALERDTAGAAVYAVAAGEVVYADFSYPGRVVIVKHDEALYSMYGHLDPGAVPAVGTAVRAGDQIGTVLQQAEVKAPGQAPSHLHFEVRDFLIRDDVNGNAPQYGVNCGFQCPPGPGYWPQSALTHPVDLGWLNPTEAALGRIDDQSLSSLLAVPNTTADSPSLPLLAEPTGSAQIIVPQIEVMGIAGIAEVMAGPADAEATSADAYDVWARVVMEDDTEGWVQVALPSSFETGSDGRPSSIERPILFRPGAQ